MGLCFPLAIPSLLYVRHLQLTPILTLYEIANPPVLSGLSGIPDSLLCNAIAILAKTGRAQLISISDGDGVQLFLRTVK